MQISKLTAAEVAERVRPYVEKTTIGDTTLWLEESKTRLDGKYWEILVRPSHYLEKQYIYFDALNAIEAEVQEKEGIRLMIIPGRALAESQDSLPSRNGNCGDNPRLTYEEMNQATLKLTATEAAARVRPYVAKWTLDDITFCVPESGTYLQNDFWHVPIRPSREPDHQLRYFEELSDLIDEVQECEGFHMVFDRRDPLTDD